MDLGRERQLAIFGGTFNPIHLGHTQTVAQLIGVTGLDEVKYVPAAVPPHRAIPGVSAQHRLEMVRIATGDYPNMAADSRELERDGPSYTLDTVLSFREEYPKDKLHLILGLDAVLGMESWYRWETLLDLVNLIVMVRPGWSLPKQPPAWWTESQAKMEQLAGAGAGKMGLVPITPVDISSTVIRQGLRDGSPVQQWLHAGVWQYIQDHKLYE